MSTFSVSADLGPWQNSLEALAARASNLQPAFQRIGEELLESTQRRFVDEAGPDGAKWHPLSPQYATSKAKTKSRYPNGVLKKSGQLAEGIFYEASRTSLMVASPEIYSAIHQFGGDLKRGGKMPARPYLGLSKSDLAAMSSIVEEYLAPI